MRRTGFGKSVVGKRRTSTGVRGHYRRKPNGGRTYVKPHRRKVMKNVYQNFRYTIYNPLPIKHSLVHKSANSIFSALGLAFPQYSPLIEVGRFAFNNRERFASFFKTMFSNESDRAKIEFVTNEIEKGIKNELINEFSKRTSAEITGIIDRRFGFPKMLQSISKDSTEEDAKVVRGFFDNTLEKIILESSKKVMDLG